MSALDLFNSNLFTKKHLITALAVASAVLVAGCDDDDDNGSLFDNNNNNDDTPAVYEPVNLTIAHINDHHSHLEPEGEVGFVYDGNTYEVERGGFARVKTLFDMFENMYGDGNFLKLHAGDAITGTQYFSFYKGDADADLMNTICFDAFALGNHEFDEGDAGLVKFLDRLNGSTNNPNNCQTPVLAANVMPKIGTPLAPNAKEDYIQPYVIKETKQGVKVGIIGIDIAGKTQNSSRPLETTEFLDELTTAQNYINELKNKGIEHIVLLTHYTYEGDKKLAQELSGVDVIIGGDSHTLLGDFTDYTGTQEDNLGSQGDYPTVLTNKDGNTVCIGQAWEYTKAVGLMDISFDENGDVTACNGSAIIPVGDQVQVFNQDLDNGDGDYEDVEATTNQMFLEKWNAGKADLLRKDIFLPVTPDASASSLLATYTDQLSENLAKKIGEASEVLCLVRVPGTTRSEDITGCEDSASSARGSDIAQVVATAFLDISPQADFAIQNAGGVRTAIKADDITNNTAYTLLPFGNTLVNLDITGQQVKDGLEEAIANHMDGDGSSGSHPYATGLRWDLDLSKPAGSRLSNLEVKDRATGNWTNLDMNATYVVVTNDFIAEGRDGYTTFGEIFKDANKVEDTKLLYTQSFIDYVEKVGTISRPDRDDYSHKTVITADGKMLNP